VKLKHLTRWNAARNAHAKNYNSQFKKAGSLVTPFEPEWSRAVYHLYVVRTDDRESLMAHLKDAGIGTGTHYPVPLHLQKAYASKGYRSGDFPNTEQAAATIVSLPMFPSLTAEQQARVVAEVARFAASHQLETAARV
jgi:dTDP-4-amino-4,6-dideoxygalactose transaminase